MKLFVLNLFFGLCTILAFIVVVSDPPPWMGVQECHSSANSTTVIDTQAILEGYRITVFVVFCVLMLVRYEDLAKYTKLKKIGYAGLLGACWLVLFVSTAVFLDSMTMIHCVRPRIPPSTMIYGSFNRDSLEITFTCMICFTVVVSSVTWWCVWRQPVVKEVDEMELKLISSVDAVKVWEDAVDQYADTLVGDLSPPPPP
jgi:hypothetical protein